MKRVPAVAMALAVLVLPGVSGAETVRLQSEKTLEGRGLTGILVENARGLVRVTASKDGKVHLTAVKESRGNTRRRAEKLAEETHVTADNREGVLQVKVHYPRREHLEINIWQILLGGYDYPRFQVRLGLEVPPQLAVEVRTTSGDVLSDQISGTQLLASTSGDVSVHSASGSVRASSTSGDLEVAATGRARLNTVSGDIIVTDARGPIHATSTSGDLTVRGASDSLVLNTVSGDIGVAGAPRGAEVSATSGDIVVRDAAGVVQAETASGDVSIRLVDPLQHVDVSTTSGDITTRFLSNSGCTLDLSTASGTIDVSLPVELRTATRRALRGKVGNGAVPITLTTASGDIAVRGPRN